MTAKTIYFFAILCMAQGKLLQEPEDIEAVVGQVRVVLKCQKVVSNSASPVEWRHTKVHAVNSFEIVYKRGFIVAPYNERYEVVANRTTGQYDLIIKNVTLHDAGTYTCTDRGHQRQAELIVFEKYPSNEFCTTTSSSDGNRNKCRLESVVVMSCDMRYRGNLAPVLEWLDGENTIPSSTTNDTHGLIKSSIQLAKGHIETAKYTCHVKYRSSTIESRFTWSSTVNTTPTATSLNLSYGGCDMKTIDCSDGNSPQCKYIWLAENGSQLTQSSSIDLAGKPNGNYTCLAICSVRDTPCSYVAKRLNYECHDKSEEVTSTTSSLGTIMMKSESTISSLETMMMKTEAMQSVSDITSPGIYIPMSILVIGILIGIIILLLFRRSLRVWYERTSVKDDAVVEKGQITEATELTQLNGTTLQGTQETAK